MDWRLIIDNGAPGAWNMAVDEAMLLHAIESPEALPTVRFYDWQPPCLSLGRLQKIDVAALESSIANRPSSIDIVRRPTGGRAVLHQYEVTYCVVLREALLPPESRSVLGSYRWLSTGWVAGLRALNLEASLAQTGTGDRLAAAGRLASHNCFAAAAQCDFLVAGKKLIGAAQCRRQGVILQHGSLLLDVDAGAWETLAGGSMSDTVTLRSSGVKASRQEVTAALCRGLEQTTGAALRVETLTEAETAVAHRLHRAKYTQVSWTRAGKL